VSVADLGVGNGPGGKARLLAGVSGGSPLHADAGVIYFSDFGGLPAPSYPYALTITNPGAETGDTTGWTHSFGAGFFVSTSNQVSWAFDGTYHFRLSSSDQFAEVYATPINIPSEREADCDAGLLQFSFTYKYGNDSGGIDWGRNRVEFWSGANGTGTFLGQRTSNQQHNSSFPSEIYGPVERNVPPNTRSIVIYMFGFRTSGTELSFYFDSLSMGLIKNGSKIESIYKDRGVDTSGWTVDTGTGQPVSDNTWSNWGWPGITPGSQAAYAIRKDVTPSSAALTAIAAGGVTLSLQRYAWNENADDTSRTYVQCLDNTDAVVATVQDAASNTNWSVIDVKNPATVSVPTSTVKFRVRHSFARVDGTVLDAAVGFMDVYLTW